MRIKEIITEEPIKLSGTDPRVKEFIAKVYDMYPQTWQNNHVMPLGGEGDDQQFAMFELVPSFSKRGAVEVKWIQAYPLGQGVGARAMKILQDLARKDGISLTLYPWDKGQVSQSKLIKFYKKQGFQPANKGSKNMVWSPAVGESISESFEDVKSYWQSLGIDFFMYERGNHISLSQIVVPKGERSEGLGTKAMQSLINYADSAGKTITLTPSSDFGGSKTRLVDFYRRFGFVPNKGRNKDFRYSDSMIRTPKTAVTETRQLGEYVYHASYVGDDTARWLKSLIQRGLQPSKEGYSGPGTYFAYAPDEGYYHVSPEDSKILRVRWADLAKLYGVYPDNPNGIERDDDEIIVPGPVPGNILEVEYFEGEWWDLKSALAAETYHYENVEENFADGKRPGRKGLAKRMGVDCSKSETELRKIAKNSSGERQRMAHWCANMKGGKK